MARLEVKRQLGRGDIDAVSELIDVATKVDGHRPLGEHHWLDLINREGRSFAGLVAWEPGHDHPVGFAQVTRDDGADQPAWVVEYVVDPHHRDTDPAIGTRLVAAALDIVRDEGGGQVQLWVAKPTEAHDRLAAQLGLGPGRELRQLRRRLPSDEKSSLPVRQFVPVVDDGPWLEVNNRAFRGHPDQGGWDLGTFRSRQEQPWFDPAGLLLHEREGRLAGFCWTKVHADQDPPLGEIYVLGVDPDYQGLGLGRELTLRGLELLGDRGLGTAMLYVDHDNVPALRLYEKLGFYLDHVDRSYVGDLG